MSEGKKYNILSYFDGMSCGQIAHIFSYMQARPQ